MWHSYVTWLFHSDVTLLIQNWHLYVTCLLHTGLWFSPGTTRSYETRLIYTWHGSPIWDLKENTFYGSLCQSFTHMRLEREHILWISLPVFHPYETWLPSPGTSVWHRQDLQTPTRWLPRRVDGHLFSLFLPLSLPLSLLFLFLSLSIFLSLSPFFFSLSFSFCLSQSLSLCMDVSGIYV